MTEEGRTGTQSRRFCVACGVSIDSRGSRAVRCVPCAESRRREAGRNYQRKVAEAARNKDRRCADCGVSINDRGHRALVCLPCAARRQREGAIRRARNMTELTNKDSRPLPCIGCGQPIEGRSRRAKYCVACVLDRKRKISRDYQAIKAAKERKKKRCIRCGGSLMDDRTCSKVCLSCRQREQKELEEWRANRQCVDCGVSLVDRGPRAIRCSACAYAKKLKRPLTHDCLCEDCGGVIDSASGNARFCSFCEAVRRQQERQDDLRRPRPSPLGGPLALPIRCRRTR